MPIISTPKASVKAEQLQETTEPPLSKPIASIFISNKGADLSKVLPCADLGDAGEAQCDKCKLKGAEGGVAQCDKCKLKDAEGGEPIKSEGYVLIACGKPRR